MQKLENQNMIINSILYLFLFGTKMVRDVKRTFLQFHAHIAAGAFHQMRLKTGLQDYMCFVVRTHDRLIVTRHIHFR